MENELQSQLLKGGGYIAGLCRVILGYIRRVQGQNSIKGG